MADQIISDFGASSDVKPTDIMPFQRGVTPGNQQYGYYTVQQFADALIGIITDTFIIEPPQMPTSTPRLDFSKSQNSQYIPGVL